MLAATDDHAKSFSVFLQSGVAFSLDPFYHVLSAYPFMGKGANKLSPFKTKLAMEVRSKNTHWLVHDVARRHWLHVGQEHGVLSLEGQPVGFVLDDLANRTLAVVRTVKAKLPNVSPQSVSEPIFKGLLAAADRLMG